MSDYIGSVLYAVYERKSRTDKHWEVMPTTIRLTRAESMEAEPDYDARRRADLVRCIGATVQPTRRESLPGATG